MHIISLGAGVQSTTVYLKAERGEILPRPIAALFADTGAEPRKVMEHLDWLGTQSTIPIIRVSRGNLRDEIYGWTRRDNRINARPPFFTEGGGMLRRQCTQDYKLMPLRAKQREMIGLAKGQRGPKGVAAVIWVGISTDEAARMKPSKDAYFAMRWPLIERNMSRNDCLRWLEANGYPRPPKSACTFCPYHDDAMWRDMKENDPESFADAVAVDAAIRPGDGQRWFIHRSLKPLAEVDFRTAEDAGQLPMFDEECEGLCGT